MSTVADASQNNNVGPVMRQGELAQAVVEAAEIDNPEKVIKVEDKLAYLRIQTSDEMILKRQTIEEMLGRPFSMNELEVDLASFAGRIDTHVEYIRFYHAKHL
ncbi:MAG TPA: MmoB/DmpM family protein [Rugosibacter sp.]